METRNPIFNIKKPIKAEDDDKSQKSDVQPINDDNEKHRQSLGPDLLWEEIK